MMDLGKKAAILKASPSVVTVIYRSNPDDEDSAVGGGIIVECQNCGNDKYDTTILTPAVLFKNSDTLPLLSIEVDVGVAGGEFYKGEVVACDFHYNLAAVRIQTDSELQVATLRGLDIASSIDMNDHLEAAKKKPFRLGRHSELYKILPGTKIMSLKRAYSHPYDIEVSSGVFSVHASYIRPCKELFRMKVPNKKGVIFISNGGGPVINYSGEVIGIVFSGFSFLPSNLVSRWWNHYKGCREFCRPWLGLNIANLHEADTDFLEQFVKKFPNIATGVVVTEVEKDSPAYRIGILRDDVVTNFNGEVVRSKLEFFEKLWDSAGKSVEVIVRRASDGDKLNLSLTIEDTPPDKFYGWGRPTQIAI